MNQFTFSIFDGNLYNSSASAWPTHDQITFEAENDRQALSAAQELTEEAVTESGAYEIGDEVVVNVWDAEGVLVGRRMLTVSEDGDFARWSSHG